MRKPLNVEFAPGDEPEDWKPWSIRERCIVALCSGYLSFVVAVWLEMFPPAAWVAGLMLLTPLLIVALLEKP